MNEDDKKRARRADLATLESATPALRTLMAFAIYLRYGIVIEDSYGIADQFLDKLKKDYQS